MARKTKQAVNLSANEVFGETSDMENIDVEEAQPIVEETKPIKARGIGKFIIEQIMTTTDSNQQILDKVLANFDGAKTTMACIAWYKTKLRKEGRIAAKVTKTVEEVAE